MRESEPETSSIDLRLARRLRALRREKAWSLDVLAEKSGVSRATLSRIEHAEVSPTAQVLGRLCAVHDITLSHLIHMAETRFEPLISAASQAVWADPENGFIRRSVSPPSPELSAEVIACELRPGAEISYGLSPHVGLEHHLVLLEGALTVRLGEEEFALKPGDCLRYRLLGASGFCNPGKGIVRYMLFLV